MLGTDALRYFLLREMVFGQDGSFSYDALVGRYNSDLANGLGNLASRTLTMIHQYRGGVIPESRRRSANRRSARTKPSRSRIEALRRLRILARRSKRIWALISAVDKFIVEQAPWKLAKGSDADAQNALDDTLYTAAEALRIVTALLSPVLPESAAKIWAQLGMHDAASNRVRIDDLHWGQLQAGQKIGAIAGVFPRIDAEGCHRQDAGARRRRDRAAGRAARQEAGARGRRSRRRRKITIDDFVKVDLRVGLVLDRRAVKGADKLLHLKVDIGEAAAAHHRGRHRRSLQAGAAGRPQSSDRRQSAAAQAARHRIEGMIVAASLEGGKPVLAGFLEDVPVGARLK